MTRAARIPRTVADVAAQHGDVQALPASFAQVRFFVLDQLEDGGDAAYTVPIALRLEGRLDGAHLENALNHVVERHEALRTVFAVEADELMQVVLPAVRIAIAIDDLRSVPADQREAVVQARATSSANASFDLGTGPLLRASLLRLADEEHVLLLALHHIVADGSSIGILFDELERAYSALLSGRSPALAALPLQYPDFAVWQRRAVSGAVATRQLAYWTERLRALPTIELPTDRARPAIQSAAGGKRERVMSGDVAQVLREVGRREGATPYMTFLAAFVALLYRYTGQSDVVVGSITSGRRRPEVEPLIGLFLNTLAIRVDAGDRPTFIELLQRVRERATEAYANQDVPFERVVEAVEPARDRSRSPIFQVAFQFFEGLNRELRLPGLTVSRVAGVKDTTKFDLTLMVHPLADGRLRVVVEYASALFDVATIDGMLAHYAAIVASIARTPDAPVAQLNLLAPGEDALVTSRWNATSQPIPSWTTPERVLETAAASPTGVAIRAGADVLTYAALASRAGDVARRLVVEGVRPGDRVGVCMERTGSLVVALLGTHLAGAAYVPLDPAYPADRIAYVLEDAGVAAVLADAPSVGRLPHVGAPVIDVETVSADHDDRPLPPLPSGEAPAYVIYTSGSTGKPKGVVISHRALSNFLMSMAERPGLSAGDALVAVTTVSFDIAGLELWLPLVTGAEIVLASRKITTDGVALRDLIDATSARTATGRTLVQATPATWALLIDARWSGGRNVVILCGGEAWPARLADSLLARAAELWNVYGPTETTIWSARHRVTRADDVPLGEPIANTVLLVLEPSGLPAPLGVPGELWIGGEGLAAGYHRRPELTAERFVAHPRFGRLYRTGDRVRRRPDGRLEYLGRLDDQVKLRGYRIELGEIEAALAAQPAVAQAVASIRTDDAQPRLVAYVVLADAEDHHAAFGSLRDALKRTLPDYMVPSAFVRLDDLPLTPNGKIDRRALPAPSADALTSEPPYRAPRTALETQIAAVWADVLGRERVGVDDDFFALGGHSLLAMRVAARLVDVQPVRISIAALFDAPTVARLARLIEQRRDDSAASRAGRRERDNIPRRLAAGLSPLSHAQEALWLFEQMTPGTATYNVPVVRRVRGPLDVAALTRALDAVMARHEALRTVFVESDGEVSQRVVASALPFAVHDLRGVSDREARAHALLRATTATPFDLALGPPFRIALIRLADDESLLTIVAHHIVFDGGSVAIFLRELALSYDAARAGAAAPLSPLPIQPADHAAWERAALSDARVGAVLEFWRQHLRGAPPSINLPTDRPRSASAAAGPGARYATTLSPAHRAAVQSLAKRSGATTFMVLMASFQALLHRASAQDDLVVGIPISGRERVETEQLIGHLVSAVALRARFEDDPTFQQLVGQVRRSVLGAFEHRELPYEHVARAVRDDAAAKDAGLFDVMFNFADTSEPVNRLGDAVLEPLGGDIGAAKFALSVTVAETPSGLRTVVEYRSDLFDESTIARLVRQFASLIESAARDSDERISRLPLASDAEQCDILSWSTRPPAPPVAPTMHGMFEYWVAQQPDALAVSFGDTRLTYAELETRANDLAARLRLAGVERGTIVGLCVERSLDFPIGALAVLKAGGAYLPLDPSYPRQRLAFMIEDSQAPVLVTQRALIERLPGGPRVVFADEGASLNGAAPHIEPGVGSDDLAYIIYTSGSTGRPKGARLRHGGAANLAAALRQELGITARERVLQFSALSFDASALELLWSLAQGASLQLVPQDVVANPDALAALIDESGVTATLLPPVMLRAMDPSRVPALSTILSGGEACGSDIVDRWAPNRRLFNAYGPTEVTVMPTMARLGVAVVGLPIGGPLPGCRVYVLDAAGTPVPVGIPGELYIGGAGVGAGYLRRPELTRERFLPDPFIGGDATMYRSGDRVRWRGDRQLDYLGRLDQQVKLRGFRIELGEIESVLANQPGIAASAVVVRTHSVAGERLVGYFTAQSGHTVDPVAILAGVRLQLPAFMVPSALLQLDGLPLTPSGKLDRAALPEPPEHAVGVEEIIEPRSDIEAVIAGVWRDVLRVERIGMETSLFDLGGHSLVATRIVGQVSKIFRTSLPLRHFFERPTVAGVARAVADLEPKRGQSATIARLYLKAQQLSPDERERLRRERTGVAHTTTR